MTDADSDAAVVRRCLAGETRAFGTLVDRYQKVIYNVALRMVRDADDAADLSQAVFVQAYENLARYDPRYRFYSWIYRMAVNASINFARRRARLAPLEAGALAEDGDATPEARYASADVSDQVGRALLHLTPEDRALVILKHLEDFSYRDIAFILDLPEKTVKSRLYEARQRLKTILIRHRYVDEPGRT